jgi:hypothetical protein
MRIGIATDWVKHLRTEAERKSFEEAVRHDTLVLGRLKAILEEKISNLDRMEGSLSEYENPSWAYKQAHMNGIRAGLTEAKNLLSFLDRKDK